MTDFTEEVELALYKAFDDDDIEQFAKIYKEFPDLDLEDSWGRGFFEYAADEGSINICKFLYEQGVDPNKPFTPLVDSALDYAVSSRHKEVTEWLLSIGASPNGNVAALSTPLVSAVYEKDIEALKLLLEAGAEPNLLHCAQNRTPLDTCIVYRYHEMAELLRQYGAFQVRGIEIDFGKYENNGVLLHIWEHVGEILDIELDAENQDIKLRLAKIRKERDFKVLFTNGLYKRKPHYELMVCIDYQWPVNQLLLKEKNDYGFFMRILSVISERLKEMQPVEGMIFDKKDFQQIKWPIGIDGFMLLDYKFSPQEEQECIPEEEEVTLWFLLPFTYPKAGKFTPAVLKKFIERHKTAKWKKIGYRWPRETTMVQPVFDVDKA